jgi:hypothetical protein
MKPARAYVGTRPCAGSRRRHRAGEPKRLELFPGGHLPAYTDQFERTTAASWFAEHLRPGNG